MYYHLTCGVNFFTNYNAALQQFKIWNCDSVAYYIKIKNCHKYKIYGKNNYNCINIYFKVHCA